MANAANREALQSKGGGDVFAPPDHLLVIAEEDPKHPNHHEHMLRVRPDDPENVALLSSFREFGWPKSMTISVYKDGKVFKVSNGRRRLTFVRIENARRKKERDKRGAIRPRIVLDEDPILTEGLANSLAKSDPPMVIARRFIQYRETNGAGKACAMLGITLEYGNHLARVLATPSPELHKAVNERAIAVDVAARAADGGSAIIERVLAKAKDADGKVDGKKARAAAQVERPPRAKARSAADHAAVAAEFARIPSEDRFTGADLAALAAWLGGDAHALDAHPRVRERAESGLTACGAAKKAGKGS